MVKSQLSSKSPHRPLAHVPPSHVSRSHDGSSRRELSDRASASDRIADADADADASRSRSSVALSRRPAVAPAVVVAGRARPRRRLGALDGLGLAAAAVPVVLAVQGLREGRAAIDEFADGLGGVVDLALFLHD